MSDHAPLPPSGASGWMQCPKWPSMQRPETDRDNTAAAEGTAAHEVLATLLRTGEILPVGHVTSNGVAVDADMTEAAGGMAERILAVTTEPFVEARVHASAIHADCWGTCDVFAVVDGTIYVWDFKYGHGYVEAYRNWQLIAYAQGVIEAHGLSPLHNLKLSLNIYQPRNYHKDGPWREWSPSADEHRKLVDQMHLAAKLVSNGAHAKTGPACKYCSGRAGCEALQRSGMYVADMVHEATGDDLPDGPLGAELSILKHAETLLKARITGLEEVAKVRLRSGAQIQGWSLEQGYGREKWTVPPEEVFAVGDAMDMDLRKPSEPITPAQARKKGLDATVTDLYATKPAGEIKLVPVSEHRAAKVFS